MNLSLVLLYIHLGLIPDLCFIANILFNIFSKAEFIATRQYYSFESLITGILVIIGRRGL